MRSASEEKKCAKNAGKCAKNAQKSAPTGFGKKTPALRAVLMRVNVRPSCASLSVHISGGHVFLFDREDFKIVKSRNWYPNRKFGEKGTVYVIDREGNQLHQILLKPAKGFEVDHIDLDPLNNKRENLRICTHQQNQCTSQRHTKFNGMAHGKV